ncbi:hypothetical protein G6F60_013962 [Rhizopus arrhizus]|nr:hypothetical protein G6F60_013962 [Rhizopus arrhizus]
MRCACSAAKTAWRWYAATKRRCVPRWKSNRLRCSRRLPAAGRHPPANLAPCQASLAPTRATIRATTKRRPSGGVFVVRSTPCVDAISVRRSPPRPCRRRCRSRPARGRRRQGSQAGRQVRAAAAEHHPAAGARLAQRPRPARGRAEGFGNPRRAWRCQRHPADRAAPGPAACAEGQAARL